MEKKDTADFYLLPAKLFLFFHIFLSLNKVYLKQLAFSALEFPLFISLKRKSEECTSTSDFF